MSDAPDLSPENRTGKPPETVIQVSGVYKEYRQQLHQFSLRHETGAAIRRIFGRYTQTVAREPFYALHDVSFSVTQGESVGIVGGNGAGKTTLLRLLSGITKPTSGTVRVTGKFATLIGVSAGFNFDMPGRKNIYLNAAFFGWNPDQVRAIEQQIIDFADIGEFIDAPVKIYSSGMIARLGFSIAIFLLPDIIFIDEVLSVGDINFAAKCQARIDDLRKENRTIMLVSHSPDSLRHLCTRALWLDHGGLAMDGPVDDVLDAYTANSQA